MKTLIVVDMQNDFISGSLGTPEAREILPAVCRKIEEYRKAGGQIIFTRDTHHENYADTQEGRNLPVEHCIKGTWGWEIADVINTENDTVIDKETFGYGWSAAAASEPHFIQGEELELVGLCTDICVISNALGIKAAYPELPITVDASCCAGVTPESHNNALEAMKMCQIKIVNG